MTMTTDEFVDNLDLSLKASRRLKELGICSLEQLTEIEKETFTDRKGVGDGAWAEVRTVIHYYQIPQEERDFRELCALADRWNAIMARGTFEPLRNAGFLFGFNTETGFLDCYRRATQ